MQRTIAEQPLGLSRHHGSQKTQLAACKLTGIWGSKLYNICSVHIGLYQRSSEKKKKSSPGNYPELFSLRETNEALINFLSNTAN